MKNTNVHERESSRKSHGDKRVMLARGCLSDAKKWFTHRGWNVLPQNERGRRILQWGADQAWLAAGPSNPRHSVRRWCRCWWPTITALELDQIVAETETRHKSWSHDQSATVLEITMRDRQALQLRFLGANDDPDYERRNEAKREKAAARARKFRATHSTGRPRGRPKSQGTPAWQAAGYKSKRTYHRHKARGTLANQSDAAKNGTENPSRHLSKNRWRDAIKVPSIRISAERLQRDGAWHRPGFLEGDVVGPGGCAMAAPPPVDHSTCAQYRGV